MYACARARLSVHILACACLCLSHTLSLPFSHFLLSIHHHHHHPPTLTPSLPAQPSFGHRRLDRSEGQWSLSPRAAVCPGVRGAGAVEREMAIVSTSTVTALSSSRLFHRTSLIALSCRSRSFDNVVHNLCQTILPLFVLYSFVCCAESMGFTAIKSLLRFPAISLKFTILGEIVA